MADLNITGKVTVDASQAEGAFGRVGARAEQMSEAVAGAAGRSGRSIASIGAGATQSGEQLTKSQSRIRDEIDRTTGRIENLGKTASQRFEIKIAAQGLDPAIFEPYLAKLREVERGADQANGSLGKLETGSMSLGKAFGMLAAAAAAMGLQQAFASVLNEQETMQRNMLRTEALLRANGQAAGISSAQLRTNAQQLALATLQSVEGVERSQQILLTFTNVVGSTFLRATELAADLATVTGGGLTSSMTMLGKALNDPVAGITAMARAGVSFTAQQKDTIKELAESNKLLDAQTIILDELSRQYGGVAKAEAMGYAGALDTLGQRVQELKIGLADYLDIGARTSVMVNGLAGQVEGLTKILKENAVAVSIGLGALTGAAAIAGVMGISAALGTVGAALVIIKAKFAALTVVMLANPFGLLAIGIGAAAGALVAYSRAQDQTVPGMQRAIRDLESANNGLLNLKGQAGMSAAERAGYDERIGKIKALRVAIDAASKPVVSGSVGSGDTALLRANAAARAAQAQAVASFSAQNQTATQKLNAELAKQRALMGDLFSPEIEAAIRAQFDTKVKGAGAAASAAKREADQYEKLIADIKSRIEANGLEAASGDAVTASQKLRIKLDRDLASGSLKLTAARDQSVRANLAEFASSEALLSLEKDRLKSLADTIKLIESAQQADQKTVAAAIQAAVAAETQLANYGLLKSEVQALTLAQLENARESAALAGEDVSNIQKRIQAQGRLIAATRGIDAREATDKASEKAAEVAKKAAEATAAEWTKTTDGINKSLTDALMRGFESGKSFGENLADTLKNMFATLVLQPVISAALAPVSSFLSAGVSSLLSFDGGGYTGSGPRSGGMDGRGGFMAMVHPNETVVDHSRGQSAGGQSVVINISNTIGDVSSKSDVVAGMQTVRAQILGELQRSSRYGGAMA